MLSPYDVTYPKKVASFLIFISSYINNIKLHIYLSSEKDIKSLYETSVQLHSEKILEGIKVKERESSGSLMYEKGN